MVLGQGRYCDAGPVKQSARILRDFLHVSSRPQIYIYAYSSMWHECGTTFGRGFARTIKFGWQLRNVATGYDAIAQGLRALHGCPLAWARRGALVPSFKVQRTVILLCFIRTDYTYRPIVIDTATVKGSGIAKGQGHGSQLSLKM